MSNKTKETAKKTQRLNMKNPDYLWSMSLAPGAEHSTHWVQMLPAAFATAVVILITRMHSYERDMGEFFWSGGKDTLADFFSYFKMVAICVCTIVILVMLLYRVFCQAMYVKRSFAYIPMIVYTVFVLLSYAFSEYKEYAWLGWNDRFEGTAVLLCYMILLFYVINSVNTEKNVKWIVYPVAATSALLSLLGLSQALDKDFFQTVPGQKLLVPNQMLESGGTTWDLINQAAEAGKQYLNFTFTNKEIYQTVYNINYVSFYLSLLIPLFGMIFIKSVMKGKGYPLWKKIMWGALFALLVYNLIGSASSGGLLGLGAVVLMGVIVLNKRILTWWKPVLMIVVITLAVGGFTYGRWMPEFFGAVNGVIGKEVLVLKDKDNALHDAMDVRSQKEEPVTLGAADMTASGAAAEGDKGASAEKTPERIHYIDYMETSGSSIILSVEGNEMTVNTFPEDPESLAVHDAKGKTLELKPTDVTPVYQVDDKRFSMVTVRPAIDENSNNYVIIGTDGHEWPFKLARSGVKYRTGFGSLVDLHKVPAVGFKDNQEFGSGRGYIWSRSIPMVKDTLLIGHGADMYCLYFPHEDYVGKYNSGTFSGNTNIIVDKPHNMYLGMAIGTGLISVLAMLALWLLYIVQSFKIYWRQKFESFNAFVGAGIFLGVCGFLVSAIVNDSSVSVMPMFYGLLGTGIAINMMLKREMAAAGPKLPKKEKQADELKAPKEKKAENPQAAADKQPEELSASKGKQANESNITKAKQENKPPAPKEKPANGSKSPKGKKKATNK